MDSTGLAAPVTIMSQIPKALAIYYDRFHSVARNAFGPLGTIGYGPVMCHQPSYTPVQLKFLSDVSHAIHNLCGKDGAEFFYAEAPAINEAWRPHLAQLCGRTSGGILFRSLWPLPERPPSQPA